MGYNSFAIGLAVLVAYLAHYLTYIFALYGKFGLQVSEVEERAKKIYMFGILGILSVHFTTFYAAVFAWITCGCFLIFYLSAAFTPDYNKRKYFVLGGMLYSGVTVVWWVGQLVAIFINLNTT